MIIAHERASGLFRCVPDKPTRAKKVYCCIILNVALRDSYRKPEDEVKLSPKLEYTGCGSYHIFTVILLRVPPSSSLTGMPSTSIQTRYDLLDSICIGCTSH